MLSKHGHVEIAFREEDVTSKAPRCVDIVACALAQGWRFVQDGCANLVDCYLGPKHVQDFKRAQRKDITRVITFRFVWVERVVFGELTTVRAFVERCQGDALYFKAARAHAKFARKRELLLEHFAKGLIHFDVQDAEAHDRRLIVPAHGGEVELIAKLAREYEGGFR